MPNKSLIFDAYGTLFDVQGSIGQKFNTYEILNKMLINTGLKEHFKYIVSSDEVQNYKPSMNVYELAELKLAINRDEILFVSSNALDVAAAMIKS
ncbi:HAD hydrolase-like protein [Cohnella herbarum]|uniref:HAD hydrolase-like protein n=1 Tax=Cohnella herbarum TaxID=2728023 RepID=A0A7Z2VHL2_9BACL|nr:HAD hydrolase-like protein [Cohnella herbarum]QJD83237.1 HAD hydrolase-like protein [Cohnella herbarum]